MTDREGKLLLRSQFEKWLRELGNTQWLDVYRITDSEADREAVATALIPESQVEKVMKTDSWDLHPSGAMPGCVQYGSGDVEYLRLSLIHI